MNGRNKWQTLWVALLTLLLLGIAAFGSDDILQVQKALAEKGYSPGPADGIMGSQTRSAIEAFQKDHDLPASGRLDAETQRALGVSVGKVTIPAGTRVTVLLNDSLATDTASVGDRFSMTVASSAVSGALPRGAILYGRVREVQKAKRPQSGGMLGLDADSLKLHDQTYQISGLVTGLQGQIKGKGSLKEDWKKIAIGAGVGAVVGGVAGGGKGVAAGLAIGGGGTFLATKGEEVRLPAESRLVVEFTRSVEVDAW